MEDKNNKKRAPQHYDNFIMNIKKGKLITAQHAFQCACEKGDLEVAQWLYVSKPTLNISARNNQAFRYACYNGHLQVAQWLYQIKPTLDIICPYCRSCLNNTVFHPIMKHP